METIQWVVGVIIFALYVWVLIRPFRRGGFILTEGPLTFSRSTQYIGLPNEYPSATYIDTHVPRV